MVLLLRPSSAALLCLHFSAALAQVRVKQSEYSFPEFQGRLLKLIAEHLELPPAGPGRRRHAQHLRI